jgi:hypothetical protein
MAGRGMSVGVAWLALVAPLAGCGDDGNGPNDPGDPPPNSVLQTVGGGGNVPDRYTSDLWVHGSYAYTGTWGFRGSSGTPGNAVKTWRLGGDGAPELADSIIVEDIGTVSDIEVSADGGLLLFSAERGARQGLFLYDVSDPKNPLLLDHEPIANGIHTATLADIGGRRYAFGARNPGSPALVIYDVTDPAAMQPTATVPVPANYGIHDTFVREGLAFVFAWNSGVIIYDVGNGMSGGSPSGPVEVSRLVPSDNGLPGGPAVHNGWWFHNPVSGERRYLFLGQEGPGVVGGQASGDIHVIDVSDLTEPREVAFFHQDEAGTHNFWMDEERQILYAAYYNGGVVALDVSGELEGDLADRLIGQVRPGGEGNTYTWGVQLANGWLYASDMLSGFWQIQVDE